MEYYLSAFLGQKEVLESIQIHYENLKIIELKQELSICLMTDELFDEVNQSTPSPDVYHFDFLNENVEEIILRLIGNKKLAYVESEYNGGQGGHSGILWENGKRLEIYKYSDESMNKVLQRFNISKEKGKDEFDSIELGRFGSTDQWIND